MLVRRAIGTLPPGQRDAVLLFYLQGLSYREAAVELGISVGAVKARLHQARQALRPKLAALVEPEEVVTMPDAQTAEWVDVTIVEVRRNDDGDPIMRPHVVVLEAADGRRLPIWIGPAEGTALAVSLEAVEMPRPMTYQFAATMLDAADATLTDVRVSQLVGGTYYAQVGLESSGGRRAVDARPSDALNLATILGCPIRVHDSILEFHEAIEYREWETYSTTGAAIAAEVRAADKTVEAAGHARILSARHRADRVARNARSASPDEYSAPHTVAARNNANSEPPSRAILRSSTRSVPRSSVDAEACRSLTSAA